LQASTQGTAAERKENFKLPAQSLIKENQHLLTGTISRRNQFGEKSLRIRENCLTPVRNNALAKTKMLGAATNAGVSTANNFRKKSGGGKRKRR